ncbi:MAG: sugar phosphate isomerase/epimerase [Candidatus Zixiibacteriota bacterium]|nr:MAG: sugar phosphate isomerase/epimerase [candidate division Zixibacteria bacterium]
MDDAKTYMYGISTTVDLTHDCRALLDLFARHNFDFVSLSASQEHVDFLNIEGIAALLAYASERNLKIMSAHAPFGGRFDIASAEHSIREQAVEYTLKYLQYAAQYGIPLVILHPHYFFLDSVQSCMERAARSLEVILLSKPDGVELAIENLPREEGSWICSQLLEIFDESRLGFCYDSSHENISGPPFHLLNRHSGRVVTTHLSDNHGDYDEHLVPGDGTIDWRALRSYLDRIGHLDRLLFEVGTGERLEEPVAQFVGRTAAIAREIFG